MGLNDHKFFCPHFESYRVAKRRSTAQKTYDLNVKPNAEVGGIPVEANEEGFVVAVSYANGQQLRRHFDYVMFCGPLENVFFDRNQIAHPLD